MVYVKRRDQGVLIEGVSQLLWWSYKLVVGWGDKFVMDLLTLWFEPTLKSNDPQRRNYGDGFLFSQIGKFSQVNLMFKVVHFLNVEKLKNSINPLNKWFINLFVD